MHMVLLPRILKAEKEILPSKTGDHDVLVNCLLDDHQTHPLEAAGLGRQENQERDDGKAAIVSQKAGW